MSAAPQGLISDTLQTPAVGKITFVFPASSHILVDLRKRRSLQPLPWRDRLCGTYPGPSRSLSFPRAHPTTYSSPSFLSPSRTDVASLSPHRDWARPGADSGIASGAAVTALSAKGASASTYPAATAHQDAIANAQRRLASRPTPTTRASRIGGAAPTRGTGVGGDCIDILALHLLVGSG